MMLVRAKTGPSTIHGVGLFAIEFIPKGTKVWEFTNGFDLVLTKEEVENLSKPAQEQFLNYAYLSKKAGNMFCVLMTHVFSIIRNLPMSHVEYPRDLM
ncbi:MAG TPA: hypothetical protein ACFYEC_06800 [Candidatus Brocadiaceae bacterium]